MKDPDDESTAGPAEASTLDRQGLEDHSTFPLPPANISVSLEAEVPEALFEGMREFIRNHPHWDQYSVITSALAGFLFQNGSSDSTVRDHYLAGLFSEP